MEKLEYIYSAGLRVILKTQKALAQKAGLKLINVSDDVRKVFEITGFSDFLTIEWGNALHTLIEQLELHARENPKETVLFDETVTKGITYEDLNELSGRVYAWLKQKGTGK